MTAHCHNNLWILRIVLDLGTKSLNVNVYQSGVRLVLVSFTKVVNIRTNAIVVDIFLSPVDVSRFEKLSNLGTVNELPLVFR